MKLKKIISVLEDCHTKLHYFCDDAESTPWYAEARKQLRHTIKFMERHLIQQSSGQEMPRSIYTTVVGCHCPKCGKAAMFCSCR